MRRTPLSLMLTIIASAALLAAPPGPEETWPGFRGHRLSGVAPGDRVPERWSATDNVRWKIDVPGRGWSSPIVWGDTLFVTSAINGKPFKQPTPGLYGNDYIAEMRAQGLPADEINRRVRARDNETSEEADEIRYMVYAVDAATGRIKWEREAHRRVPHGGRHRKNTYASETPFTDGERLYASFGQNVGLFCYSLTGDLLWKKEWPPQRIYLDFGTASSPVVHDGRIYLLHDSEIESYLTALDARTGQELWRTARPNTGLPKSSWTTPFVWQHDRRTEIVTTGHAMVISYGPDGAELWRVSGMSMPTAAPFAADGLLYVGTGSQGDANRPFMAIRPGASGDITLKETEESNAFIAWRHPRASGYTPSGLVHRGRAYLVHDTGIMVVLDAASGKEIYKVRVGGGGHTFSASPVAVGDRILLLTEDGTTFVIAAGDEYREIARNDLAELSLASPAIAGGAVYIRTETKLYKIQESAAPTAGQETRTRTPGAAPPPARVEDLAWLQGQWEGPGLTGPATEVYSGPAGGQIVGHFRQLRDGLVWFFEIMAIAQAGPSLEYRLKHFNEDLTGWEEKATVVRFPLVAVEKDAWYFDGLTIRRDGPDAMIGAVRIAAKDGPPREAVFKYRRVK